MLLWAGLRKIDMGKRLLLPCLLQLRLRTLSAGGGFGEGGFKINSGRDIRPKSSTEITAFVVALQTFA